MVASKDLKMVDSTAVPMAAKKVHLMVFSLVVMKAVERVVMWVESLDVLKEYLMAVKLVALMVFRSAALMVS
jgi:hypothetical protein